MSKISSLGDTYLKVAPNTQHVLSPVDEDGNINMIVEIPQGSFNKYEYVTEAGITKLDRVLYEMMPYPIEYGLIPQTWDEDSDMLDVFSLATYPTFPGCLIAGRMIGVMYMNDSGEHDSKIVVVPADDARFDHIQTVDDIPKLRRDEIQYFFEHYKDLQFKYKNKPDKKVVVEGWAGLSEAQRILDDCIKAYAQKFSK